MAESLDIHLENPGITADNWQRAFLGHISLLGIVDKSFAREVKAAAASVLELAYAGSYQNGKTTEDFSQELGNLLAEHPIPDAIDRQDDKVSMPGKRQPTFAESIDATLRRYEFMEKLPEAFGPITNSIIVGGSMSYGPFFNVRSGKDSSDVDAIMAVNEGFFSENSWDGFIEDATISKKDKFHFLARLEEFKLLHQTGTADVMSHRFHTADGAFNMSAHFFPDTVFDTTFGSKLERSLEQQEDKELVIRDFRADRFSRDSSEFYGLGGDRFDEPIVQEDIAGSTLTHMPAYIIRQGRYYPGLYQCLLLPTPLVAHAATPEHSDNAKHFAASVKNRAEYERTFNPYANILNTNPRRMILPPGRYGALET